MLRATRDAHVKAAPTLEGAVGRLVKGGLNPASNPPEPVRDHRRNHRPGRPCRIDADPELRAFVLARIDRLTFTALAEEIARAFPPGRRDGKSARHAWFRKPGRPAHPR